MNTVYASTYNGTLDLSQLGWESMLDNTSNTEITIFISLTSTFLNLMVPYNK